MFMLNRLALAVFTLLLASNLQAADQLEKLSEKENEAFTLWLKEHNYQKRFTPDEAMAAQRKFLEGYRGIEEKSKVLFGKYCRDGRQVRKAEEFFTVEVGEPGGQRVIRENGEVTIVEDPAIAGKSLSLDEAQRIKKSYRDAAKRYLKNILYDEVDGKTEGQSFNRNREDFILDKVKIIYKGKEVSLEPSSFDSLRDVAFFSRHYSFNIPRETQRRIFDFKKLDAPVTLSLECNYSTDSNFGGFIGYGEENGQCKFLPSKSIEDRKLAWKSFFYKFTDFNDEPDERSPLKFKAQIKINLDIFCSYGASLKDLEAK